jgi:signal transduction histidine kinase
MRRSLAFRLIFGFAVVGLGAAILTAVVVHLAFGSRFSKYVSAQQQNQAQQFVTALSTSYRQHGGWDSVALGNLYPLATMDQIHVDLINSQSQPVWSSSSAGQGSSMMSPSMMGPVNLGPIERFSVMVAGKQVGTALLRLPETGPPAIDQAFLASVERLLVLASLGSGLVALLAGVLVAARVTAPVRALTRAARALAAGQRSVRLVEGSPDELGQMATAFNAMADAVEAEDYLRSSFARDVAHELRTPLSILRSHLEALQDGLAEPTPAALSSLHDETLRLGRLVADLETLASADGAPFALERQELALAPIVKDAVDNFAGPFSEKRLLVRCNLAEVSVNGDPIRLRQVVSNLLSNAGKFAPSGGTVDVDLDVFEGWVRLRVSNDGPGISPRDIPRIFERFYRGQGVKAGGSGIGLAVVSRLVDAHGGDVTVTSEPYVCTTFTVRLPQTSLEAHRIFT